MNEQTAPTRQAAEAVLAFWLAAGPERWFEPNAEFDAEIRERFAATYEDAAAGRLSGWEDWPEGALALLLVLDQFPRNMFRDSARSYAADPLARAVREAPLPRALISRSQCPSAPFSICRSNIRKSLQIRSAPSLLWAPRGTPTC